MKKTIVTLFAALALVASLAACQQTGGTKIAVLDPNKVFTTCQACVEGGDYLRGLGQELQQRMTEMQQTMQDDKSEDAPAKFQEMYQQIQQQMVGEQTRIATKLDKAFQEAMEGYRAKNGVAILLNKENVLSYSAAEDATDAIVAAMDAQKIDLELPAPKGEDAKAEEAAPAQAEDKAEEAKEEKKAE